MAAAVRLDLTVALHRIQAPRQALQLVRFDAKRLGNGRRILQPGCGTQDAENFFPARDSIRIVGQKLKLVNCYWHGYRP